LHVYNSVLTFAKLSTYSASVVKSNLFWQLWGYKSLYTPLETPLLSANPILTPNLTVTFSRTLTLTLTVAIATCRYNEPSPLMDIMSVY